MTTFFCAHDVQNGPLGNKLCSNHNSVVPVCRQCPTSNEEEFSYLWGALRFDVAKAKALITKRQRIAIINFDPEKFGNYVDEEHLSHIPRPITPGLFAEFEFWDKTKKEIFRQQLVIDGTHRATLCNREGTPFYCYVLTPKQVAACTLYNALEVPKKKRAA